MRRQVPAESQGSLGLRPLLTEQVLTPLCPAGLHALDHVAEWLSQPELASSHVSCQPRRATFLKGPEVRADGPSRRLLFPFPGMAPPPTSALSPTFSWSLQVGPSAFLQASVPPPLQNHTGHPLYRMWLIKNTTRGHFSQNDRFLRFTP